MNVTDRSETFERIEGKPGRYIVKRDLRVNGEPFGAHIEVCNPAFGSRALEDWELKLLQRIAEQKAA